MWHANGCKIERLIATSNVCNVKRLQRSQHWTSAKLNVCNVLTGTEFWSKWIKWISLSSLKGRYCDTILNFFLHILVDICPQKTTLKVYLPKRFFQEISHKCGKACVKWCCCAWFCYRRLWLLSICAYNTRSQRPMRLTKGCAYTGVRPRPFTTQRQ